MFFIAKMDQSTFVPDPSKKNELKRRLYDSGISNIPMPSVKRPIEEKISSRPFSARMNANKSDLPLTLIGYRACLL